MSDDQSPDRLIEIPDVGNIAFPSSMTDAQINAAATRLYKEKHPEKKQPPVTSWVDTAVDWAKPSTGGTLGGMVGGMAGGKIGAAIGGAAGQGYQQLIEHATELPGAVADVARNLVSQPAATLKGFVYGAGEGAARAGIQGAEQAGLTGAGQLIAKGSSAVAPAVGRAAEVIGDAAQSHSATKMTSAISGYEILKDLFTGNFTGASAKALIPVGVNVGGKVLSAGGRALQGAATEAAPAAVSVAERAAQIPLKERLAQIPLQDVSEAWQAAKAAAPETSLADDVAMVRALQAEKFEPSTAIKIVGGKDAAYLDTLKKAWEKSIHERGIPIQSAALASSGKVSPAVKELMASPTFKALADAVASRQP